MGLRESVRGKWSGDSDLCDGKLQELKRKYNERLVLINNLEVKEDVKLTQELMVFLCLLDEDKQLLQTIYGEQKRKYEKKLSQTNVAENNLFGLAWDVVGIETLLEQNMKFSNDTHLY